MKLSRRYSITAAIRRYSITAAIRRYSITAAIRRYSITAAIRRRLALNVTDRHEIICHGLDVIYAKSRHQEKCLKTANTLSM